MYFMKINRLLHCKNQWINALETHFDKFGSYLERVSFLVQKTICWKLGFVSTTELAKISSSPPQVSRESYARGWLLGLQGQSKWLCPRGQRLRGRSCDYVHSPITFYASRCPSYYFYSPRVREKLPNTWKSEFTSQVSMSLWRTRSWCE